MLLPNFLYAFGAIILVAGFLGLMAGSKISMIAAAVLGGCVLAGAYLLGGAHTQAALILALVGSVGVTGKFLPAFLKSKNKAAALWPAGILAILGVVAIVLVGRALI